MSTRNWNAVSIHEYLMYGQCKGITGGRLNTRLSLVYNNATNMSSFEKHLAILLLTGENFWYVSWHVLNSAWI